MDHRLLAASGAELAAQAVLDALPDLRFRLARDGTYLDFHAPARELMVEPDSIVGRRISDFLPPELARTLEHELITAIDEQRVTTAEYALPIDGEERWHETRFVPLGAEAIAVVRDVTARVQAEAELREVQRWLDGIVAALDDYLYSGRVDPDGTYHEQYSGPNVDLLLGRPLLPDEDSSEAWEAQVHADDVAAYRAAIVQLGAGHRLDIEYRLVGADGVVRWVHDRAQVRPAQAFDTAVLVDGIVTDVTARHHADDELLRTLAELNELAVKLEHARADAERLARTDALTGCCNRRHGREVLEVELERALRTGAYVGVLMLDIDHFKAVNDTFGHRTGDDVLVAVAECLTSRVRPYDCVARWGGEEFVVVLPTIDGTAALARTADSLRARIADLRLTDATGRVLNVTASVGAVLASAAFPSVELLVDAADRALYAAKRDGRNRVGLVDGDSGAILVV